MALRMRCHVHSVQHTQWVLQLSTMFGLFSGYSEKNLGRYTAMQFALIGHINSPEMNLRGAAIPTVLAPGHTFPLRSLPAIRSPAGCVQLPRPVRASPPAEGAGVLLRQHPLHESLPEDRGPLL